MKRECGRKKRKNESGREEAIIKNEVEEKCRGGERGSRKSM